MTGTGRTSHLRDVNQRFKNGFREGTTVRLRIPILISPSVPNHSCCDRLSPAPPVLPLLKLGATERILAGCRRACVVCLGLSNKHSADSPYQPNWKLICTTLAQRITTTDGWRTDAHRFCANLADQSSARLFCAVGGSALHTATAAQPCSSQAISHPAMATTLECIVCLDADCGAEAVCAAGHLVCRDCLCAHAQTQLAAHQHAIVCPGTLCKHDVEDSALARVLGPAESKTREKLARKAANPRLRDCPKCSELVERTEGEAGVTCSACGASFCFFHGLSLFQLELWPDD
jgi:hypothetical protein